MKNRLVWTLLITLLSQLFLNLDKASAMEPCFANISDSAWINGEPTEVTSQLNFDLVGKRQSSLPDSVSSGEHLSAFDSLALQKTEIINKISYEYEGKNCTKRIVTIEKIVKLPQVLFVNKEQLVENINKLSNNYLEAQGVIENVNKAESLIKKSKIEFNQVSQIILSSSNEILRNLFESFSNMRLNKSLGKGLGGPVSIKLNTKECFVDYTYYGERVEGAISLFDSRTNSFRFNRKQGANLCQIEFLLSLPPRAELNMLQSNYSLGITTIIFKPNVLAIEVKKNKPITIVCSKGKLIKRVTGMNPKCPSGYKKN